MESTFQTVIEYLGIMTSLSTLIFNILLIRPCLKVTNVYPNFVLLNLNFIISSMICALYFLFTSIHKLFDLISCEVIIFIRCFSTIPLTATACILFCYNVLILRGSTWIKKNVICLGTIYIFIIWVLSIIRGIISAKFFTEKMEFKDKTYCLYTYELSEYFYNIHLGTTYVVMFFLSIYSIFKVCSIKSNKNKTNQLGCMFFKQLIFASIFCIADMISHFGYKIPLLKDCFVYVINLMNITMVYSIVFIRQIKDNFNKMYCGKIEPESILASSEISELSNEEMDYNE